MTITTSHSPSATSITSVLTPPSAALLLARVRGYGYAENQGVARREQRSLTLLIHRHVTPLDLTLTADGCPVVVRYRVQSEAGNHHYYVTRVPNETTPTYTCTCPDTWQPCKHAYAATLFQHALHLAHIYRAELPTYDGLLATLSEPLGSHELTALRCLLATATRYAAVARDAAQQYYGATVSYRSQCFSRFIDQVRWCYGSGYVGYCTDGDGELHSVAGTHVLPVRWHPEEIRWYIVGADDTEDAPRTRRILDAALPHWLQVALIAEPDTSPLHSFEAEEEPDGHYHPVR